MVLSAQGGFEDSFSQYMFAAGFMGGEMIGGQVGLGPLVFQRRNVAPENSDYASGAFIPMSTTVS